MKLLILSDSHASLYFMRMCMQNICPDAVFHLGDYYHDAQVLQQENPTVEMYAVPGNCDCGRIWEPVPETRLETLDGVRILMTHGHRHHVKQTLARLLEDARAMQADIVLFGHTHEAYCQQQEDGLWVVNPGSCGYGGGSAGIVQIEHGHIVRCSILRG